MSKIFVIICLIIVGSVFSVPVLGVINKIPAGGQIFVGESELDITSAVGDSTQIAWWSEHSNSDYDQPDAIHTISNPVSFFADPTVFEERTGNWYNWRENQKAVIAFYTSKPEIDIEIWNVTSVKEVTNDEIPIGNFLNFEIKTNMRSIVTRPKYQPNDAPFRIKILGGDGTRYYDYLIGKDGDEHKLTNLAVNQESWFWVSPANEHDIPAFDDGWNTAASDTIGDLFYKPDFYTVWVECNANNIKDNYRAPDGSEYTEKTISSIKLIKLVPSNPNDSLKSISIGELEPTNNEMSVDDWVEIGSDLASDGKEEEAIEAYDKAIQIDINNADEWYSKGMSLSHLGKHEDAIQAFDKALSIKPADVRTLFAKGMSQSRLGKHEDAIQTYDQALLIDPVDLGVLFEKEEEFESLGKYQEQIEVLDQIINISPNLSVTLYFKGKALKNLGKYEDAIIVFDEALLIEPDAINILFHKGEALFNLGKYEDAIVLYDQTLLIYPVDAEIWNSMGYALTNLGRYDEAQDAYDQENKICTCCI